MKSQLKFKLFGSINYVNKKYIFSYCLSINKEYLIHQYSFILKWFNFLYLLFFKDFYDFISFCSKFRHLDTASFSVAIAAWLKAGKGNTGLDWR